MINPVVARFADMIENFAVIYDGKKQVFRFYADNAEVVKNVEADKDFCQKFLVYNEKKVEMESGDKKFYGIIKKVKNGEIEEYYEDVFVVKREDEIVCLVGFPPENEGFPKDEDGDEELFIVGKGYWYTA